MLPQDPFDSPDPSLDPAAPPTAELVTVNSSQTGAPNRSCAAWSSLVSWSVVIAITLYLSIIVALSQIMQLSSTHGDASVMDLQQIQLQGRMLVGQTKLGSTIDPENDSLKPPTSIPTELDGLDTGPYEQRLCYSILVNEFAGPGEAIIYLKTLDEKAVEHHLRLTPDQARLRSILEELFRQYDDGDHDTNRLSKTDLEFLSTKLKWLGELAQVPKGTPNDDQRDDLVAGAVKSIIQLMIVGIFALLVGCASLAAVITFIVLASSRKIKATFTPGTSPQTVYIETFAIWMILFVGSSFGLRFLNLPNQNLMFALQVIVFFASLAALGWPVVRGLPFSQVRKDIGWSSDRPFKEVMIAFPAYLVALPCLIPGIVFAAVMTGILSTFMSRDEFARQSVSGHPIAEDMMSGNFTIIALVFIMACVAAPIVEETMFRGVLYRHLRDSTSRWHRWLSIVAAALINGFIFASIHPQGIIGIPVLASLAVCFSLVREWRSSLIAPMLMHAVHNGLITCFLLLIL